MWGRGEECTLALAAAFILAPAVDFTQDRGEGYILGLAVVCIRVQAEECMSVRATNHT